MPAALVATKFKFPVPDAANPIPVFVLAQLYTVPGTKPVKLAVTVTPAHTVWLACAFTVGVGLTVIVKLIGVPAHPLAVGVTVIVATTGALVILVATKLAMLPLPAAASPIDGALLVQLNTVPATVPTKFTAAVLAPLHSTWLPTAATVGVGFTVIVKLIGVPVQLMPPLI